MPDASFAQFVVEQLHGVSEVRYKQMFGGFGLYSGEVFFGIVSGERVFFKTNDKTCVRYEEMGSECFRPSKKQVIKNYWEVPMDIVEDPHELEEWAREAIGVALGEKGIE